MSLHFFEQMISSAFPELSRSDSNRSIYSTIAVEDAAPTKPKAVQRRRGVHFVHERENQVFYRTCAHSQLTTEESRALWYSRQEIANFRQEMHLLVDAIFESDDPQHIEWFVAILDAYVDLNGARTTADMEQVLQSCQMPNTGPHLVGLEKSVLRKIVGHRQERREHMYRTICGSGTHLTRFHFKTSCEASRTDRIFARYAASMHV